MAAAEAADAGAPIEVTGRILRQGLALALGRLEEQRDHINQLNVFPVPDGDTGSNLHLTLSAACAELGRLRGEPPVSEVAAAAAHGALMGARGNSGVILSQVLRGWSLRARGKQSLDARGFSEALSEGSRVADQAVKRPVEGTILSVARAGARAVERELERGAPLAQLAETLSAESWAAVERTRDQMALLREAGVVDAGGFGLAVVVGALAEQITGTVAEQESGAPSERPLPLPVGAPRAEAPEEGFGYCTEFGLSGSELEPSQVRSRLGDDAEDDSALVVGEPGLLHVHVHTRTPWEVLARAAELGTIERLKVEDMTAQHREAQERAQRPGRLPGRAELGVVAVAQGEGFKELFQGLGAAAVVEGGQSHNPSTEELLQAIQEAGAEAVVLLPNNPNLQLGCEQAVRVCGRPAAVVASENLPQGVAALLAFDPGAPLEVNRHRMEHAMEGVHAIEVTAAVRETTLDGRPVAEGTPIALLDGRLVSAGEDLGEVVLGALQGIPVGAIEVVTLYRGAEADAQLGRELERAIRARFPHLEVELHEGGQSVYQFIVSAE